MANSKKSGVGSTSAIDLLTEDHANVKKMFKEFDKTKDKASPADKQALAEQICNELKLHTRIEEEIFYPAVREAIDEDDMMNEAEVEHAAAKDLIAQIEVMDPSDEMYDAKVTVLSEQIEHHVEEEEKEMFPKVKKSELDLKALGDQMQQMKDGLQAQMPPSGQTRSSRASAHR